MTATTFDALTAARDLESAGIERHQAEAIAKTMRDAAGADRAELPTKADLADFATKADLADFATKADLADFATKADLADFATKADLADFATKADLADFATKADLHREIGTLRSEVRWMSAFQGALILAMAAKLFGIV